jgi:Ca-activated chloride channel family protein
MLPSLFRDWPAFLLLPLIALPVLFRMFSGAGGTVRFSSLDKPKRLRPSWTLRARHLLLALRVLALVLIVVALARPQKGKTETRVQTEGIDIELVVDASLSMQALDMDPRMQDIRGAAIEIRSGRLPLTDLKDRLEVVKDVVREFVKGRAGDQIGLTVFAETAQLQCPLTTNHGILLDIVKRLRLPTYREQVVAQRRGQPIFGTRTAIGWGIASGANRLAKSKGKSKVMILLTDGSNNVWDLTPETATDMAAALKIKVYTIGAGTEDQSYSLAEDMDGSPALQPMQGSEIDEALLKKIADATGGKYFRAKDERSLRDIYREIDEMEKVRTEGTKYTEYHELFPFFLLPALGLLLLEVGLANTRLMKLP